MRTHPVSTLIRGIGAGTIANLCSLVISILQIPLFLAFAGSSSLGDWTLLASMVAYASLGELALAPVTGSRLAQLLGKGDRQSATELFWAAVTWVSVLELVLSAAVVFGLWYHLADAGLQALDAQGTLVTAAALSIAVILSLHTTLLAQLHAASGNYPLGILWSSFTRIAEFAALALALAWSGSLPAAAIAMALTRAACNMLIFARLKKARLIGPFTNGSLAPLRGILRAAAGSLCLAITSLLQVQLPITLVGFLTNGAEVASFAAMRTIVNVGFQLVNLLNGSLIPSMARSHGRRSATQLRYLNRLAAALASMAGVAAACILFAIGPWLFSVWTRGQLAFDKATFVILLVNLIATSIWYGNAAVAVALNRVGRLGGAYLFFTITSLALCVALLPERGSTVALGLAIANATMGGLAITLSLQLTQDSLGALLGSYPGMPKRLSRHLNVRIRRKLNLPHQ